MTGAMLFAGVLPERIMHTQWFAALSMFVAINTVLYLTLAIIKLLPKAYLSDWINQRNRRSESRSIYPDVAAGAPGLRTLRPHEIADEASFGVPWQRPAAHPPEQAELICSLLKEPFLSEIGFDPARLVLHLPEGHRLIVRPACQVEGCSTTATKGRRICPSCQRRLSAAGLGEEQIELLEPPPRVRGAPGTCLLVGCGREQLSRPARLCRAHHQQREAFAVSVEAFLEHPAVVPLAPTAPCSVAACPRQRRHPDGVYCQAHQLRLRVARSGDPSFDEAHWRRTEPPIGVGGEVSLRGLEPLVVAQVLFGLQQRCLIDRVQTKEPDLRAVCDDLRRKQVSKIEAYVVPEGRNLGFVGLASSLIAHASRALATPETQAAKDEWDPQVLGQHGSLSFIS